MKTISFTLLLSIVFSQKPSDRDLIDSQVGNCPTNVEAFESEIFNGNVYRGSFSPDGRTFYYFKKITAGLEDYRIFTTKMKDGEWSEPEVLEISGSHSDLYPSISKDGKRMVFVSYRPVPEEYRIDNSENAHLWYTDKVDGKWSEPVFMAEANKIGHYHAWAEFGWDGNIYFKRLTPDYQNKVNLFTEWDGKKYTTPKVFEEVEQWRNSTDFVLDGGSPGPTKDIVILNVLTFDAEKGRGASIWYSRKVDGNWKDPKPMNGDVNQTGYQNFQFYSPEGSCLYFVRNFRQFYRVSLTEAFN